MTIVHFSQKKSIKSFVLNDFRTILINEVNQVSCFVWYILFCVYIYIYFFFYIYIYIFFCIYIYIYIYIYFFVYIYIYIYCFVYIYIYIYILFLADILVFATFSEQRKGRSCGGGRPYMLAPPHMIYFFAVLTPSWCSWCTAGVKWGRQSRRDFASVLKKSWLRNDHMRRQAARRWFCINFEYELNIKY